MNGKPAYKVGQSKLLYNYVLNLYYKCIMYVCVGMI